MGDTPRIVRRLWATHKDEFDWARFDAIRAACAETGANRLKYLDAEHWLVMMWCEAVVLDLHQRAPCRILDIGSGPGYFPYVCSRLGHEAWALDRPDMPLFVDLRSLMQVPFIEHAVRPRTPLPSVPRRFDLVTAHRVQFNAKKGRPGEKVLFDLDDWGFFLDDVRDRVLAPDGRLVLKMIDQGDYAGLKFGDPELMDYFRSRGAVIKDPAEGRYVIFDRVE